MSALTLTPMPMKRPKQLEAKMFLLPQSNWGGGASMPPDYQLARFCSYGGLKCSSTCCPSAPYCARPCCITKCHAPVCPTRICSYSHKPPPCSPPRFCRWKSGKGCGSGCESGCGSSRSFWDCCYTPNACYKQLCSRSSCCGHRCGPFFSAA